MQDVQSCILRLKFANWNKNIRIEGKKKKSDFLCEAHLSHVIATKNLRDTPSVSSKSNIDAVISLAYLVNRLNCTTTEQAADSHCMQTYIKNDKLQPPC